MLMSRPSIICTGHYRGGEVGFGRQIHEMGSHGVQGDTCWRNVILSENPVPVATVSSSSYIFNTPGTPQFPDTGSQVKSLARHISREHPRVNHNLNFYEQDFLEWL